MSRSDRIKYKRLAQITDVSVSIFDEFFFANLNIIIDRSMSYVATNYVKTSNLRSTTCKTLS